MTETRRSTLSNYLGIKDCEHYTRETPFLSLKDLHDFEHRNLRVELEALERILARHDMRIYYVDTTAPRLRIPSVCVYVTNTCFLANALRSRNALMAMIRECLQTGRLDEAERHIRMDGRGRLPRRPLSLLPWIP